MMNTDGLRRKGSTAMKTKEIRKPLNSEKGIALVSVILIMSTLVLLGSTAVIMTSTDLKISGNYKLSEQAFYAAEAGVEEARARMRSGAASPITDGHPTQTAWSAFIGDATKAQGKGYNSGNSMHVRVASLQSALDYTVKIEHSTDSAGNIVATPAGYIIYLVRSYGAAANARKTLRAEITRPPPIPAPAALYVKAPTTIQGSSTHIIGSDRCGTQSVPGVVTTLSTGTVTANGGPTVCGVNATCAGGAWDVVGGGADIDVQSLIDRYKSSATSSYNVTGATHTGSNWGTPTMGTTLQDPSSCSTFNIVHYNTNGTDIKLAGGSSGCGLLLVEGDLEVNGGFTWYGMVLVSGSVRYLGGGDKNVTGAVLAGSSMDADLVGGNANIVYCSSAIGAMTANQPWRVLSWIEEN
jgi:Tfp pilus assembly protein PilX